jgi:hypothetical protein
MMQKWGTAAEKMEHVQETRNDQSWECAELRGTVIHGDLQHDF